MEIFIFLLFLSTMTMTVEQKIKPKQYNLDVQVYVDYHFINFHKNDTARYTRVLMSLIANEFSKDPGLDANVRIYFRTPIFQSKKSQLPDSVVDHRGNKDVHYRLNSFCDWQNKNLKTKNKPDLVLLFTGQPLCVCPNGNKQCNTHALKKYCSVVGIAYIAGTCTENKNCAIIEDTGFGSVLTAVHEIGHSLHMFHDAPNEECRNFSEISNGSHRTIMNPVPNYSKPYWSKCSNQWLKDFTLSNRENPPTCLYDVPAEDYPRRKIQYPGRMYDRDAQCAMQNLNSSSKSCPYENLNKLCNPLWCGSNEEGCSSKNTYVLNGASCGENKMCINEQCMKAKFRTQQNNNPAVMTNDDCKKK